MTHRSGIAAAARRLALTAPLLAAAAFAQGAGSAPVTNAFGDPASPFARMIRSVSWEGFWIIIPFIVLAEALLVYAIFRFRKKPGAKAAKFHENPGLEITWTLLPLIAVLVVEFLTHAPMHFADYQPPPDQTVMVVGHRFFWEYRYPQYGIDFSNKDLVVPAGRNISLEITSVDVIHGFYVPALGVQMDAVPGRITHAWFNAKEGNYKGQCAQLCGPLHGEMWIDVRAVPPAQFSQWLRANATKGMAAANAKALKDAEAASPDAQIGSAPMALTPPGMKMPAATAARPAKTAAASGKEGL